MRENRTAEPTLYASESFIGWPDSIHIVTRVLVPSSTFCAYVGETTAFGLRLYPPAPSTDIAPAVYLARPP